MLTSGRDLPQVSLQISQDDKFFTRLMTKETSMANTSSRVYYGMAKGEVPFMWESQPGTPKHPMSSTTLPPLTPPPSYLFSPKQSRKKKHHKSNLLMSIIPKLNMKKNQIVSSLSSSESSSISSSSLSSTWSVYSKGEEEDQTVGSPTSTLCFGIGRDVAGGGRRRYYSAIWKKSAFLAIVGHGSR